MSNNREMTEKFMVKSFDEILHSHSNGVPLDFWQ